VIRSYRDIDGERWETTPFLRFVLRDDEKVLQQLCWNERGDEKKWIDIPTITERSEA
jgi:hypothetical protein